MEKFCNSRLNKLVLYLNKILLVFFIQINANSILLDELKKNYIDFYESLSHQLTQIKFKTYFLKRTPINKEFLILLEKNYDKINFAKLNNSDFKKEPRIPKILHQIWLGSPFPEKFKKWQKSWKQFHPAWKYILWTDKDIKNFKFRNRELFDRVKNYGQKSDILRYEILYRMGGLYVDADFECFKSFDSLVHSYDFIAGINPIKMPDVINNCIIGSIPMHPILKHCIMNINDNHSKKYYNVNSSTLKKAPMQDFFWFEKHSAVIRDTGPIFFGKCVLNYFLDKNLNSQYRTLLLPPTYFFPLQDFSATPHLDYKAPECFAKHYWAGTWWKDDQ